MGDNKALPEGFYDDVLGGSRTTNINSRGTKIILAALESGGTPKEVFRSIEDGVKSQQQKSVMDVVKGTALFAAAAALASSASVDPATTMSVLSEGVAVVAGVMSAFKIADAAKSIGTAEQLKQTIDNSKDLLGINHDEDDGDPSFRMS